MTLHRLQTCWLLKRHPETGLNILKISTRRCSTNWLPLLRFSTWRMDDRRCLPMALCRRKTQYLVTFHPRHEHSGSQHRSNGLILSSR